MFQILLKAPQSTSAIFYADSFDDWINIIDCNIWLNSIILYGEYTNRIIYNDEVENHNIGSNYAHAKGILYWNNDKIRWIIHSVPNWPLANSTKLPNIIYGQSFICIDLSITYLSKILNHLSIMNVYVYNSTFDLQKLIQNQIIDTFNVADNILHIAKSDKWDSDLFDDYLAPLFGCNLLCESWLRPVCKDTNKVHNSSLIKWPNGVSYTETHDHSKYAISTNKDNPWVYIGDLNHMKSQAKRGGGGFIIKDEKLWKVFYSIIKI